MTIEKLFDTVIIEEWARTHCGSAKEVRAQCVGLSNTSTKYITHLLEELAATGRIPVTTVNDRYIGRSMNQMNKLIAEGKL